MTSRCSVTTSQSLPPTCAMRRFQLLRQADATGVSGTGIVAEGVMFGDGRAVMRWLASALDGTKSGAINMYASIEELTATHGHGGRTTVVWTDEEGSRRASSRSGRLRSIVSRRSL